MTIKRSIAAGAFWVLAGSAAAFPAAPTELAAACDAATIDAANVDATEPLPACVATHACGNGDAADLAGWLDASADEIASIFRAARDYYPGRTLDRMCSRLDLKYRQMAQLAALDFSVLSPARQRMVEEAADHVLATLATWQARDAMSKSELSRVTRQDRGARQARRDAQAEASRRVRAEDRAEATRRAAAAAQARQQAADALQRDLLSLLTTGAAGSFLIETDTGGGPHASAQTVSTLDGLVLLAASRWRSLVADGDGDEFTPPAKGEFETTDQYQARIAEERAAFDASAQARRAEARARAMQTLQQALAAAFAQLRLEKLRYDADTGRFDVAIATTGGVAVADGTIAVPLDAAPAAKERLSGAKVIMGFDLDEPGQRLTLSGIALVDRHDADARKSQVFPLTFASPRFDVSAPRIAAWRAEHEQRQTQQRRIREAEAAAARQRIAAMYPYEARFTCNLGALQICLGTQGSIRVRSGNDTEFYTARDVAGQGELGVSLASSFDITAELGRAAGRVLTLEVVDFATGATVYREDTAGSGGVIRVSD